MLEAIVLETDEQQVVGGTGGIPTDYEQAKIGLALFDLSKDIGETTDVKDQFPEVVARMKRMAQTMRADLGDSLTETKGSGLRPAGRLATP